MKKIIPLMLAIVMAIGMTTSYAQSEKTIKVCVPDGIPALTMAKMMKDVKKIDGYKISYEVSKTPDLLATKVLKSQADVAIVPSNLAIQAFNKGLPYKLQATGGWGSLYLISDEKISDVKDLKGKEIYLFGKGLTPDLTFRYVMKSKGIDIEKDIKLKYVNSATEMAPLYISGKAKVALMAEPMLSNVNAKKKANIALDLNSEWKSITGSKTGFPQSSLIIKNGIDKDVKEQLIKKYGESVAWANKNPKEAGAYLQKMKLSMNSFNAIESIKRANLNFKRANESKEDYLKYYKVLYEMEKKSIGGKLPGDDFFEK